MNALTNSTGAFAHWVIRLALATVFLYHGYQKIFGEMGVSGFSEMMDVNLALAWLVSLGEVAAGILILVGGIGAKFDWATRASGAIVVMIMLGAIQKAHFVNGFSFMNNGYEFQFVLVLIGIFFILVGNGINHISFKK